MFRVGGFKNVHFASVEGVVFPFSYSYNSISEDEFIMNSIKTDFSRNCAC